MAEDRLYQIALARLPKVGGVLARQLVGYCGSAAEVFRTPRARLLRIPGVGPHVADQVTKPEGVLRQAEQELQRVTDAGVSLLFFTERTYPQRLVQIYDAPPLLYYQGIADLNAPRTVAVVGTRQATDYGKEVTEQLIAGLKPYGCLVVSGLAYGIDIAAHKAAQRHALPTVGVMASGLDIIYPAAHRRIAEQMRQEGGLLTENPYGTRPDAPLFPARNRIIAGLSDAVVVVEAALKGGALITARMACEYDREVLAVPGDLGKRTAEGCHRLIRDHQARIYTSPDDVAYALGWNRAVAEVPLPSLFDTADLPAEDRQLLDLLRTHGELMIDELGWRTQMGASALASRLLALEFQGYVKALPGKKFALAQVRRMS